MQTKVVVEMEAAGNEVVVEVEAAGNEYRNVEVWVWSPPAAEVVNIGDDRATWHVMEDCLVVSSLSGWKTKYNEWKKYGRKYAREEKEMIIRQLEVVTDHDFSDFFTIQLDSYIFLDQNYIRLEPDS